MEIDHPIQPIPQEEDELLCGIFCQFEPSTKELLSLNRYRIAWNLLFLLGMVSANDDHIEHTFLLCPLSIHSARPSFSQRSGHPSRTEPCGLLSGRDLRYQVWYCEQPCWANGFNPLTEIGNEL